MAQQENDGLPTGWKTELLGDAASIITKGTTPTTSGYQYIEEGIPFIKVENIIDNRVAINSVSQFISEDAHAALARSQFVEDDVLFSIAGTIGKTALVKKEYLPCNTNQAVAIIRGTNDLLVPDFLNYQLINFAQKIARESSRGGAMNNVSLGDLKNIKAMVAPLLEQKRIVEKLDSLLAQVDIIQQRLNHLPNIIKRFRQSVLAAAVSGKLTEQWREENSIASIKSTDYFDKKLGGVESKEYYGEPPESWGWVRFGSLVKLINGDRGKNYPNKAEYVEKGVPFINTGHIDPNGFLSKKRMNFITKEKFDSLGSGKIKINDLVYCLRGATMGKTAIVNPFEKGAIASSLVIVRPSSNINNKFAYYFLISPQAKDLITRFDNGSAQPNLSAKSLAMYPLCLSSVEEQIEIVRLVEQHFALADTLEKHLANAKQRVDNLAQSILSKAFKGELVPQDPNDEPADKLLARIKAARLEADKLEKAAKKVAKAKK
jgi:type I restriction enzyme S subunit